MHRGKFLNGCWNIGGKIIREDFTYKVRYFLIFKSYRIIFSIKFNKKNTIYFIVLQTAGPENNDNAQSTSQREWSIFLFEDLPRIPSCSHNRNLVIYLFIYEFLPGIASSISKWISINEGPAFLAETPTKEPIELSAIRWFTAEGLTRDRTLDCLILSSTP